MRRRVASVCDTSQAMIVVFAQISAREKVGYESLRAHETVRTTRINTGAEHRLGSCPADKKRRDEMTAVNQDSGFAKLRAGARNRKRGTRCRWFAFRLREHHQL
jgi:hypothetical protein